MADEEKKDMSIAASQRFTDLVLREFGNSNTGELRVTEYQKQLIQGYFINIDKALKSAEEKRLAKNAKNKDHDKYDEILPCVWSNVNMADLAQDIVLNARLGLDMMESNHLFPIPFKNNRTNRYDIQLMKGYNGIKYIAEKYALDQPSSVTIELVYATDKFEVVKKCYGQKVENYHFEITKPFDRGELLGGFIYLQFSEPEKNKLIFRSRKEIEKRKPKYAGAEFWGGETTAYEDGKPVTKKIDGWYEEMCYKTLVREAYGARVIPRDPSKVDELYHRMKLRDAEYEERQAVIEIDENANGEPLPDINVDVDTGEVTEEVKPNF